MAGNGVLEPVPPSAEDAKAAREAVRTLGPLIREGQPLRLTPEKRGPAIEFPAVAVSLLVRLLKDLAAGHAVTIIPVHALLTTQQAADILGVSRPHVIKLLEEKRMPHTTVGAHRRIRFEDLAAYRQTVEAERKVALDELARQAQELDLGY